jgi:hypothetical protein
MDPDVGRGQAAVLGLGHHDGGRRHRGGRLAEHEHPPAAQPADRPAAIAAGNALHQRRQPPRQLCRDRIALFLGQPGVPGQVYKAHTRRGVQALVHALGLQDALQVADGVVEPDVLAVPPVDARAGSKVEPVTQEVINEARRRGQLRRVDRQVQRPGLRGEPGVSVHPWPRQLPQALTESPRPPWRPLSYPDIDTAVRRLQAARASSPTALRRPASPACSSS